MPTGEIRYAQAVEDGEEEAWVWAQIKAEARGDAESEPALASYLYSTILSHSSLERSLSFHLGNKLCSSTLLSTLLYDLFLNAFSDPFLRSAVVADLRAARERDPACVSFSHCLLNYKGFLACQVFDFTLPSKFLLRFVFEFFFFRLCRSSECRDRIDQSRIIQFPWIFQFLFNRNPRK